MNRENKERNPIRRTNSIWRRVKTIFVVLLGVCILAIGAGFVYEAVAAKKGAGSYPPTGKLVDAGGYNLHFVKKGSGTPTVVLEAGSGETSLSWRGIPDELSQYATVVVYDRAGYAWSEQAPSARSGDNIVRELHEALQNEGLKGPYLMVGHSLGGMYARLFTQTYPNEVTGLVLVDARPENDERESKPILEEESFVGNPPVFVMKLLKNSGIMRIFKDWLLEGLVPQEDRDVFVNVIASSAFFEAKDEEGRLAYMTEDSIRGQQLGNLPVRIITRGIAADYVTAGISEEGGRKLEAIWQAGQREMLDISSDSKQIIAESSGHMIIHDQPELVVDTIRELLFESVTIGR